MTTYYACKKSKLYSIHNPYTRITGSNNIHTLFISWSSSAKYFYIVSLKIIKFEEIYRSLYTSLYTIIYEPFFLISLNSIIYKRNNAKITSLII